MSTVDIIEEPPSTPFVSPTISFESVQVFNYETILVFTCVISSIALLISFFKRKTHYKQY
jgi:hypothetical protein